MGGMFGFGLEFWMDGLEGLLFMIFMSDDIRNIFWMI